MTTTFATRLAALRKTKQAQTREKQRVIGAMDYDDWALILPPPALRKIVKTISPSGVPITDVLLRNFTPKGNHANGNFYGPRACGENYRLLLESHPVYVDPMSSLAGGYMVNFTSYWKGWNPDFDFSYLKKDHERYQLHHGIGGMQHFCQDLSIGLSLGWGGILKKIRHFRNIRAKESRDFYAGLEHIVLGMQNWIRRHAKAAASMARTQKDPILKADLLLTARINSALVTRPPKTFREACQWMLWFQLAARMYNGSGSLGRIDALLQPFYENGRAAGTLTDEEAVFHIACLLLRDTAYIQLGGIDARNRDTTNPVSFLTLEAMHRLKIPSNIGVCVGTKTDRRLVRAAVEILVRDKLGLPKFLGYENTIKGLVRFGIPFKDACNRVYSGCHWTSMPGREYGIRDIIKINFAAVFQAAFDEITGNGAQPSTKRLWQSFSRHLEHAVSTIAQSIDFHMAHMHKVFPELVMDLCCHGPIEKGRDASDHGVQYTNIGVDGAALATVADSFGALEERIEIQKQLSWKTLVPAMRANWKGGNGEALRMLMKTAPRFGSGGSAADAWAVKISHLFARLVAKKPTPKGHAMIPGLFSWALSIPLGKNIGPTPNGRRNGDPVSHGPNPDPGFRKDAAPTALAVAVAAVQPGYGNSAPLQLDFDPGIAGTDEDIAKIEALIRGHFALGGTQINVNVMDKDAILKAHRDPSKHPDLVVRVTGFSAYFASLSKEFRQLVVNRILAPGN